MDLYISQLFSSMSTWMLSALVAGGLFFVMVGVRELNVNHSDGLLYVTIGAFFFGSHFYLLNGMLDQNQITAGSSENLVFVWNWLTSVFAPALIALFLLLGAYHFVITRVKVGLTRIFFGLSLPAFLYWLGATWSIDIKGILTLLWTLIWFDVELEAETA
ncbi:hypothetical protein C3F09_06675 [candidate division GN15 bacterium]|uniref:Uncharacterized protein n=1 Tax=candidate division GN15 bacterium TaxID=2072418 RepID=A0A855X6S3_9BACT|nr:MAG: hypothetical protein C3F09_06675 [candidate division GN15 bacterium]